MRTDIRLFRLSQFGFSQPPGAQLVEQIPNGLLTEGVQLGGRSQSLDSHSILSELAPRWQEKGVLFGSVDELVAEHGDLIKPHLLSRAVDPNYDKFAALHAACFFRWHVVVRSTWSHRRRALA